MTTKFDPSKLDFDDIKSSLKTYFESSSHFNDYNFEGSGLSVLLDVLAHNTHINAMNANFATNEAFIDTAQLRGSVASHAKPLNYLPRSRRSPVADVELRVLNVTDNFEEYLIPKYTKLTTSIDGKVFTFYTLEEYTANNANDFTVSAKVYEGKLMNKRHIVDTYNEDDYPIYVIPDPSMDTSTMTVLVREGLNSTASETYTIPSHIGDIHEDNTNYFLSESANGRYEMLMGDGIVGKQPLAGSVIDIKYLKSSGPDANEAGEFVSSDTVGGKSLGVTTITRAYGGAERESIDSIKFNAPKAFAAQDRAVTEGDYSTFLQQEVSYIESLNVWGGEKNDPPKYGTVFICVKPVGTDALTDSQKEQILENVLDKKNVITITPTFVDAEFQYIEIKTSVRFESQKTILTASQMESKVKQTILDYGETNLSSFESILRKSKLNTHIDQSDDSVVSVVSDMILQRRLKPTLNLKARYNLKFTLEIAPASAHDVVVYSDSFEYAQEGVTYTCRLRNKKGTNQLEIYRIGTNGEVIVQDDAGYIDTAKNTVILMPFSPVGYPNTSEGIRISAKPADENNIYPQRNLLISIDPQNTAVSAVKDVMVE